jgi:hypothetical protein
MANNIAFQPMGKTYKANATTSVQQFQMTSDSPVNQYMIVSHEPTGGAGQPVYVRISTTSTANVALPGNGSAQYCTIIPPDTVMVVTGPQVSPTSNVYVTFIAETGTPECYITPGEGLA